ncbi:MAG: hypothetical protein Greene041619_39 [Candidatus Peregrinibacteria bacterium Greene0416_19]|nr:MAG: hypothetical protein Greene041619_39 [Candidatus Peregrinibacteria bacterium Greene0416_19]
MNRSREWKVLCGMMALGLLGGLLFIACGSQLDWARSWISHPTVIAWVAIFNGLGATWNRSYDMRQLRAVLTGVMTGFMYWTSATLGAKWFY